MPAPLLVVSFPRLISAIIIAPIIAVIFHSTCHIAHFARAYNSHAGVLPMSRRLALL